MYSIHKKYSYTWKRVDNSRICVIFVSYPLKEIFHILIPHTFSYTIYNQSYKHSKVRWSDSKNDTNPKMIDSLPSVRILFLNTVVYMHERHGDINPFLSL